MKLHRTALAALVGTAIGSLALAPAANAQQSIQPPGFTEADPQQMQRGEPPAMHPRRGDHRGPGMHHGHDRGHAMMTGTHHKHRGGLSDFARSPVAIELALVRIAYAVDLDQEQQDLLSTLRSDLIAAHSAFVDATADLRPDREDMAPGEPTNMSDMLASTIAMQRAQLNALEAIQPSFDAFMSSLTDEQRETLHPRWQRPDAPGAADPVEPAEPPADIQTPNAPMAPPAGTDQPAPPPVDADDPAPSDDDAETTAPVG